MVADCHLVLRYRCRVGSGTDGARLTTEASPRQAYDRLGCYTITYSDYSQSCQPNNYHGSIIGELSQPPISDYFRSDHEPFLFGCPTAREPSRGVVHVRGASSHDRQTRHRALLAIDSNRSVAQYISLSALRSAVEPGCSWHADLDLQTAKRYARGAT